jgi:hypothetical protein
MSLLKLPPELWAIVLGFACTDGGVTGCALSLVSRAVNRATATRRYHSVSLMGWSSIRGFLTVVDRSGGTVFVRHLFIATLQTSNDGSTRPSYRVDGHNSSQVDGDYHCRILMTKDPPSLVEASYLIRLIFAAVKDSLQTFGGFGLPIVATPSKMPALRDMIIHYSDYLLPNFRSSEIIDSKDTRLREAASPELCLPSLRRVHLLGLIACQRVALYAACTPALEIIRCSRPGYNTAEPVERLQSVFPAFSPGEKLIRIILQPAPRFHPWLLGWSEDRSHHEVVEKATKRIGWPSNTVDLRPMAPLQFPTAQTQEHEWLEIVRGRCGPWDLSCSSPTFRTQKS